MEQEKFNTAEKIAICGIFISLITGTIGFMITPWGYQKGQTNPIVGVVPEPPSWPKYMTYGSAIVAVGSIGLVALKGKKQ